MRIPRPFLAAVVAAALAASVGGASLAGAGTSTTTAARGPWGRTSWGPAPAAAPAPAQRRIDSAFKLIATANANQSQFDAVPPEGFNPGDGFAFGDDLTNQGAPAGTDDVDGLYLYGETFRFTATIHLTGHGDIQIQAATITSTDTFNFPVVGGTGEFAGAGGTLTVRPLSRNKAEYRIALILP